MLTDHETRREHEPRQEHEARHEHETAHESDAQLKLPVLEEPAWEEPEPAWADDDADMEMDAPPDSPLRGMWIGIAAAAITFVLVFAIPQWLGWYDVGPPPQARRDATPESIIATVTAKPSAPGADEPGPPARTPAAATPAPAPPDGAAKAAAAREAKPAPPAAAAAPRAPRRTFSIQIAAFKSSKPAGELAAKVKRSGYPADVGRVESASVPWVVRVGSYTSREQAESARDALARKGFKGFIQ